MSATQDKTQKVAFVYSNLYQIYKKGKNAAQQAAVPTEQAFVVRGSKAVLKSEDLRNVEHYKPAEFIAKRVARPEVIAARQQPVHALHASHTSNEAVESLKKNLKSLNDLHSRLRFMLQEIEDLVKE